MANNLNRLDGFQVLKSVYNQSSNSLRVSVVEGTTGSGGGFEVIISHTEDSIRLGDGTNFFTSTSDSGKLGLDVNVINEIDIRQLDSSTDNIAISDGTDTLSINADGSINVNIAGAQNSTGVTKFAEASSVAASIETTLVSHISLAGRDTYIQGAYVSGENIAEYRLKVNGTSIDLCRTNFGSSLNASMVFDGYENKGYKTLVGDVISLTVIHERSTAADFNGRLKLLEIV